ncbi:MAG: sulfurtransferase [Candidatus Melainabacteria bacterium]|nr:sulfurtransferase [Candidatus Melainabacteria bacterium]
MKHTDAFERLVAEVMPRIREIAPDEVLGKQNRKEPIYFIDVREDHEWEQGRAVGCLHIGRGVLERDIARYVPDCNAEIILYCGGGYRSALAADNLQKMGYQRVFSMAGGIRSWREKGFPEEGSGK